MSTESLLRQWLGLGGPYLLHNSVSCRLVFVWLILDFICAQVCVHTICGKLGVDRDGPFLFLESAFGHMEK